jgi:hypothetical protein
LRACRLAPGWDEKQTVGRQIFSIATRPLARLKSGPAKRIQMATRSAPSFSPYHNVPAMRTFFAIFAPFCGYSCFVLTFASLRQILVSDQRLINQVSEALEEAMLIVWEVLGKNEHDEFFSRINGA